jgi:hypothetical protein
MQTALDNETARIADQIVNEFIRLGVSAIEHDPCSGLMARIPNVVTDIALIDIYDDYTSGFYDGAKVLAHLRSLASADYASLWQEIAPFCI